MTIPENLLENTRHRALHEAAAASALPSGTDGQFLQLASGVWVPHTLVHSDLGGVSADQHHTEVHAIDGADHDGFPGGTSDFLRADGTFATPPGTASPITIKELDGTPSGTPSTLEFPNGTITDHGSGVYEYVPAAPAAPAQTVEFLLDAVPASPHALDDEFAGTSLDAKWTNPLTSAAGQTNTLTFLGGWMLLEPSASGSSSTGKHVFGIQQVAPTGDFTVMAKMVEGHQGSDIRSGVFVGIAGGKGHVVGPFLQDNSVGAIGVTTISDTADWSGYDGYLASFGGSLYVTWIRIRWVSSSGTLFFDYSQIPLQKGGTFWTAATSRTGQSQPNRVGLCLYSNSGAINADETMAFDFFRVTEP